MKIYVDSLPVYVCKESAAFWMGTRRGVKVETKLDGSSLGFLRKIDVERSITYVLPISSCQRL